MAERKRSDAQREYDYQIIADLYLKGHRQSEIAQQLELHQTQISYDLRIIQKRWRESAVMDFNEAKQRELSRIDTLEREAWQAYERSKSERVRKREGSRTAGESSSSEAFTEREERDGDPRFMEIILKCIVQRSNILGINAAVRVGAADWRDEIAKLGGDPDAIKRLAVASIAGSLRPNDGGGSSGSSAAN